MTFIFQNYGIKHLTDKSKRLLKFRGLRGPHTKRGRVLDIVITDEIFVLKD